MHNANRPFTRWTIISSLLAVTLFILGCQSQHVGQPSNARQMVLALPRDYQGQWEMTSLAEPSLREVAAISHSVVLELTRENIAMERSPAEQSKRSFAVGYCDTSELGSVWLIRYEGESALWMLRVDDDILTMQKRISGGERKTFRAVPSRPDASLTAT